MGFLTELFSSSTEQTEALGVRIAANLLPGMLIALRGEIGAGKTCLVKGIAKGLGVKDLVTSPTYIIINEYQGYIPVHHVDAYRLSGDEDFENTGASELFNNGGITLIEWSERIPNSIPAGAVTISIQISGEYTRIFQIEGLEGIK